MVIKISTTEHNFKGGRTNDPHEISKCAINALQKTGAPICTVVDTFKARQCNTTKEYKKYIKAREANEDEFRDCFDTKSGLTFNPRLSTFDTLDDDSFNGIENRSKSVILSVVMKTMMKEEKEEVLILSTPDLIGSIGGSLGMFFGFALAPNVNYIIDKITQYFHK